MAEAGRRLRRGAAPGEDEVTAFFRCVLLTLATIVVLLVLVWALYLYGTA